MSQRNLKILVVDDQDRSRSLCVKYLKGLGYENIIEAGDGLGAWEILQTEKFDLIISDVEMPELSGLQLLIRIRLLSGPNIAPVVIMSSNPDYRDKAMEYEANQFIEKHRLNQDSLAEIIQRIFKE